MIMFYTYLQLQPNSSPGSVGLKIADVLNENVPQQKAGIRMQPLMDIHLRSNFGWDLDNFDQGSQSTLTIFVLAAMGVLLLAMINFTNLATARSSSRAREVGLRKINGAWRREIIGQFLGESVFISFLALLLALVIVYFILPLFNNLTGLSGSGLYPFFVFSMNEMVSCVRAGLIRRHNDVELVNLRIIGSTGLRREV